MSVQGYILYVYNNERVSVLDTDFEFENPGHKPETVCESTFFVSFWMLKNDREHVRVGRFVDSLGR